MIAFIIILGCLLGNAILSCAEMAFVTVDRKAIHKKAMENNKHAQYIHSRFASPERVLSVVQIGITLVGAISAAVAGAMAEEKLSPWLKTSFTFSERSAESLAIMMVVLPLTIFSVVIGELVPKSIAIRYSMGISLGLSPWLRMAEKFLGPLVNLLEKVTTGIVRLLFPGMKAEKKNNGNGEAISLHGLKHIHKQYIRNLVELDYRQVRDSMVKWDDVKYLKSDTESDEVLEIITDHRHTRIPVIDNNEVYGFLHSKEFLKLFRSGAGENWLSFVRPAIFISPDAKLLKAFRLMQQLKIHLLIVGDSEHPQGILTLEDVLEEVVGDIVDEDEDERVLDYLRLSRRWKYPPTKVNSRDL